MNELMHTTLTNLRAFVVALRASYKQDITGRTVRDISRDVTMEQRVQKSQARLSYLVPLYDAMHAAVQQAGTGCVGGVQKYTKRFDMLGKQIRKVMPYYRDSDKYFEGDVLDLQLLVPVEGVPVENWTAVRISALVAQVLQEVEDERLAKLDRSRVAAAARKAFVGSLNPEQRVLLAQALDAAKAAGSHAITVDARDLVA